MTNYVSISHVSSTAITSGKGMQNGLVYTLLHSEPQNFKL